MNVEKEFVIKTCEGSFAHSSLKEPWLWPPGALLNNPHLPQLIPLGGSMIWCGGQAGGRGLGCGGFASETFRSNTLKKGCVGPGLVVQAEGEVY